MKISVAKLAAALLRLQLVAAWCQPCRHSQLHSPAATLPMSVHHLPAAKLEPFEQAGVALSLLRAAADAHPAVDASGAVRLIFPTL